MSYFKSIISITIAGAVFVQSVACASINNMNDSAIQQKVISGDVILDSQLSQDSDYVLNIIQSPEKVRAGELITIGLIMATTGVVMTVSSYMTEKHAKELEFTSIVAEASKYDDPKKSLKVFGDLLVKSNMTNRKDLEQAIDEVKTELKLNDNLTIAGTITKEVFEKIGEKLAVKVLVKKGIETILAKNLVEVFGSVVGFVFAVYDAKSIGENLAKIDITKEKIDNLSPTQKVYNYLLNTDYANLNVNTIATLSELVKGGEFSNTSDLKYWESSNAKSGYTSFGEISSSGLSSDKHFGFVYTGLGDQNYIGYMTQDIVAQKASSAVFNVRYNFVTTEFPHYLGSQYNDSFIVKITDISSGQTKTLGSFSGSLNQLFQASDPVVRNLPTQFLDQASNGGGQTGWITKSLDKIYLNSGGKYRIYVDVRDVGDRIYDSALLIDKISLR